MPNWVINHVVITGKEEDVERFCRRVRSMDSDFDFNKIIPMPKRLMVVDGSDSYNCILIAAYEAANGTNPVRIKGTVRQSFVNIVEHECRNSRSAKVEYEKRLGRYEDGDVSIPEEAYYTDIGDEYTSPTPKTKGDARVFGNLLLKNLFEYGAYSWFDWRVKNWSTKWGACDVDMDRSNGSVAFEFQTAWAMPEKILEKVAKDFPMLKINGRYADEAIGNNCGTFQAENGLLFVNEAYGDDAFALACDVWDIDPDELKNMQEEA